MSEVIGFPDPEKIAVTFLTGALAVRAAAATVSTSVPNPRPARLVKVTRTGGTRRSRAHYDAQITVQCWDTDTVAAERLATLCYGLLVSMEYDVNDDHASYGGEIGGVVFFPDPDTDQPRYQFTLIVRTRAQDL